ERPAAVGHHYIRLPPLDRAAGRLEPPRLGRVFIRGAGRGGRGRRAGRRGAGGLRRRQAHGGGRRVGRRRVDLALAHRGGGRVDIDAGHDVRRRVGQVRAQPVGPVERLYAAVGVGVTIRALGVQGDGL